MVVCGKTWCWRASWVLQPCRQQEGRTTDTGPGFGVWNPKAHRQWDTSSNKATPTPARPYFPIVPLHMGLWGSFSFKLPQYCSHHCGKIPSGSHLSILVWLIVQRISLAMTRRVVRAARSMALCYCILSCDLLASKRIREQEPTCRCHLHNPVSSNLVLSKGSTTSSSATSYHIWTYESTFTAKP